MPEDYEVIVKFSDVPKYVHQLISLYLGDQGNRVATGLYVSDYAGFRYEYYFNKFLGDESSLISKPLDLNAEVKPIYLKISKVGVKYDAMYSENGESWIHIGSHVLISPPTNPRLQVSNWGGAAPETAIRIDSFEIVDLTSR